MKGLGDSITALLGIVQEQVSSLVPNSSVQTDTGLSTNPSTTGSVATTTASITPFTSASNHSTTTNSSGLSNGNANTTAIMGISLWWWLVVGMLTSLLMNGYQYYFAFTVDSSSPSPIYDWIVRGGSSADHYGISLIDLEQQVLNRSVLQSTTTRDLNRRDR